MRQSRMTLARYLVLLGVFLVATATGQSAHAIISKPHLADYDAELRRADGRVDVEAITRRLKELGVTTYYWLIAHAATDWDDLKLFLPLAAQARIQVWAYLVPPSESAPRQGSSYPEPFRLDYLRWAEEVARLSLQHTNLTAWVIDDFYENHQLFTPAYVGEMQRRAKDISPRLAFLPLMYFGEIQRRFVEDYRQVIDGVVVAYPQGRDEIMRAHRILNDQVLANPGELSFPNYTTSQPGDFVRVSIAATVLPGSSARLKFHERDDYTGATAGYHFEQVLLDGAVVWEQDVAGGTTNGQDVSLSLSEMLHGKTNVTVAFRLFDKRGVGNFGVRWLLSELVVEGLRLSAGLDEAQRWAVEQHGAFAAGFGDQAKPRVPQFHIPFIVMTAAQDIEFRLRHGEPASSERIASWLQMCLQACHEGECEGVVSYCLDKTPKSPVFPLEQKLFRSALDAKN
jgi:hypothetical protein